MEKPTNEKVITFREEAYMYLERFRTRHLNKPFYNAVKKMYSKTSDAARDWNKERNKIRREHASVDQHGNATMVNNDYLFTPEKLAKMEALIETLNKKPVKVFEPHIITAVDDIPFADLSFAATQAFEGFVLPREESMDGWVVVEEKKKTNSASSAPEA